MRITGQRMVTAALIGLVVVAATIILTSTSGPRKVHVANGTEIGSAALGSNLRVSLRVYKSGQYDARVDVDAFQSIKGKWQRSWHGRVPGTWLWGPLTGMNGVCSLAVTARPGQVVAIDLSLLITPAVGCSNLVHFSVGEIRSRVASADSVEIGSVVSMFPGERVVDLGGWRSSRSRGSTARRRWRTSRRTI